MNRVLTHGPEACRKEELLEIAPKLQKFNPKIWFEQWNMWRAELKLKIG